MGTKTERISLNTIAFMFPEESLERVYLHGAWQISRGRRPSLTLPAQRDPRLAFAAATAEVGDYLEKVRGIPYSRQADFWTQERITAILERQDIEDVEYA